MTRRRWIADEVSGDRAFLFGKNAEHLARVLRARAGQQFDIATSEGVRLGEIVDVAHDLVEFRLLDVQPVETSGQASPLVHLYLAIFKFDRMEWAIEKCTELGASSIVPVISQRSDAHLVSAAAKRVERWRRIVHEASQQSRRNQPPLIHDPVKLETAAQDAKGKRIVLAETESSTRLAEAIGGDEVCLAIGPEGGWTNLELGIFRTHQWQSASLGPTILRAETAAVAALAIAVACG